MLKFPINALNSIKDISTCIFSNAVKSLTYDLEKFMISLEFTTGKS